MSLSFLAKTQKNLKAQIGPTGLQQVTIMFLATSLANLLAYVFNILMGRMLSPASFGILVSLQAILVILTIVGNAAQTTVAKYVSTFEAVAQRQRTNAVLTYFLKGGALFATFATLLLALGRSPLAYFFQIASPMAVIVLGLAVIPTMVGSVIYGFLQGMQRFGTLGTLLISVATLRIILGIFFVQAGFDAVGAVAALPLSTGVTSLPVLVLLVPFLRGRRREDGFHQEGIFSYSSYVILGLICFAALTQMDMIAVKHFFPPDKAGQYAAAATLGKIVFFFPLAVTRVFFPKSSQRHALNQDTSGLVRFGLLAVAIPSGLLTLAYFLWPSFILRLVLGDQYAVTGPLIGVLGVAMTLYGLINIWLNYYLSVNQTSFLYVLSMGVLLQLVLLACFHSSLLQVATVLVVTALAISAGGEFIFQRRWTGQS